MKHIKKVSVIKAQACDDILGFLEDPSVIVDCIKELINKSTT